MTAEQQAEASEDGAGTTRARVIRAARWLLLVLPIAYLATRVDLGESLRMVATIGAAPYMIALGTQLVSIAIATLRWRMLMRAYGADDAKLPSFRSLFVTTLIGLYYGLLPSGLVGDVVRAERAKHVLPAQLDAYVVLVVDRLAGILGIVVLVAITIVRPEMRALGATLRGAVVTAALIAVSAVALVLSMPRFARGNPRIRAAVSRLPLVGRSLASLAPIGSIRELFGALVASIAMQFVCALTIASLVIPVAPVDSLGPVLVVAPAILFATFLPITPGALGQREVAFVTFLAVVGVDAERATAASLATTSLSFALGAIGFALVVAESLRAPRQ